MRINLILLNADANWPFPLTILQAASRIREFKGTVQRRLKLGSFDRALLKEEARRRFFRKIRRSPIQWEPFKIPRHLIQ